MKTLKLVAWPYSRKLILALCEYNGIECKVIRNSKTHETFELVCDDEFVEGIRRQITAINVKAKSDNNGIGEGFSVTRNIITDDVIETMSTAHKPVCPIKACRSDKVIKNGKAKGIQKYKCKCCGHNFKAQ